MLKYDWKIIGTHQETIGISLESVVCQYIAVIQVSLKTVMRNKFLTVSLGLRSCMRLAGVDSTPRWSNKVPNHMLKRGRSKLIP